MIILIWNKKSKNAYIVNYVSWGGLFMKKEYEKPTVEIIEFEYSVQAEQSAETTIGVGGWWT